MCNEKIPSTYIEVCGIIKERIKNVSFCIIAIGGTMRVGKTPLSRYLSWKLGFSLLEMDLFLRLDGAKVRYDYKYIQDVLKSKRKTKRHIIIEGCSILQVLREFDLGEIFLIYVENQRTSSHPSEDQYFIENTEHCSIKEVPDVDLNPDCPSELKEKANHTIRLEAH